MTFNLKHQKLPVSTYGHYWNPIQCLSSEPVFISQTDSYSNEVLSNLSTKHAFGVWTVNRLKNHSCSQIGHTFFFLINIFFCSINKLSLLSLNPMIFTKDTEQTPMIFTELHLIKSLNPMIFIELHQIKSPKPYDIHGTAPNKVTEQIPMIFMKLHQI